MKNILLLEDLPEIRTWLKALVMQVFPNAQIVECARVHDAQAQVTAQKFDLALIDLGLPDGSGIEVIRSVSSEERRVGKECTSVCRSRWSPYH